jgi:2-hydroxy-3-oxopropionate reductase
MTENASLGFIGLGMMGKPMAYNLLKAGFPLIVHNRSHAPVAELVASGAKDGGSPLRVAQRAEIVIMCLPDSPDVQAVMEKPDGILAGISPGKVVVDTSTISPVVTRQLAEKTEQIGAAMLDAPVSGGDIGAKRGTLSIMVGGRREVWEQVMPVLQVLGTKIVYMGESGAGQLTKACNQIVAILTLEAISEALGLAARAGVDPAKVRQALLGGFGQSRVLELHGKRIVDSNLQPGFETELHARDLRIALEMGRVYGAPLPAANLVNELLASTGYASGEVK